MIDNKKLEYLFTLLDQAESLASEFSGGYSNQFLSAQEFYAALSASIRRLKSSDLSQINKLYLWFAPMGDWDDLIGSNGQRLANQIFQVLTELEHSI